MTGTTDGAEHTWVAASTTTNTTIVWVGNITGHFSQYGYYINGVEARLVRHQIMHSLMTAENARFGGGAFPAPSWQVRRRAGAAPPRTCRTSA